MKKKTIKCSFCKKLPAAFVRTIGQMGLQIFYCEKCAEQHELEAPNE